MPVDSRCAAGRKLVAQANSTCIFTQYDAWRELAQQVTAHFSTCTTCAAYVEAVRAERGPRLEVG